MVRNSLIAASLALLVAGAAGPVRADAKFLEPYTDIFGARTFLGSPTDTRPKDAWQNQESGEGNARSSAFIIAPFGRFQSGRGAFLPYTAAGGTVGWATNSLRGHPLEISANLYDFNPHPAFGFNLDHRLGVDGKLKFVLWEPRQSGLPVISLVGRFRHLDNLLDRYDAVLAFDQKITNDLYFTGNLGYGRNDFRGVFRGVRDVDGFVAGAGLTYQIHPKLSFSANYVPTVVIDGEDLYGFSAVYAANRDLAISVGGGKHVNFYGQISYKFGPRGGGAAQTQK